jgi:hypothetical protein
VASTEDAVQERFDDLVDSLLQIGKVTGTAVGGKVVVSLRGGTMTLPRLKSYTPTTNDAVLVLCVKGAFVVLGTAATT